MVTEADVVTAYRFFLGREPENREVVEEIVRRALTLEELRSVFLNSAEFRQKTQLPAAPSRLAHCKPLNRAPNEVEAAASPEVLQRMLLRIRQEFLEMGAS